LAARCYDELNAWLLDRCIAWAKAQPHPEVRDRTIWQMFEAERPSLVRLKPVRSTVSARRRSRRRRPAHVALRQQQVLGCGERGRRPVELRAYAERIELRPDGRIVGQHPRVFGRGQTVYDPWHYACPGPQTRRAQEWSALPGLGAAGALERVRRKLKSAPDGDRQMVEVLGAVLTDGLPAGEDACADALKEGVHSADVILNIHSRRRDPDRRQPS
jgi:hypothetical protein